MCGRYVAEEDTNIDLGALYHAVRVSYPNVLLKSGEIFPTDTVPLLTGNKLMPMPASWGFPGFDGKGVIMNARAETATEKPMFRAAFQQGRCIIPATGYFEWNTAKQKHRFSPSNHGILYMAGLCRMTSEGLRFVILTTSSASVSDASAIHPRMPVLLPALSVDDWMRDSAFASRYLQAPAVGAVPLDCTRIG
ncbi:MAG: SOS response-associated peptidase family protein [Clostridia bacterium]|nr:SOS response-associated peptidase family protein [Clostridia bacterium]